MKKLLTILATTFAILASTSQASSAEYEWTMQSSDNPGIFMYTVVENYAKWVGEMSDGRIKINVVPVNSVVPYNEVLTAVGSDVLQGQFDNPAYFSGLDPAFSLIGDATGAWSDTSEALKFYYYGGGLEIAQKLYSAYDVHLIGVMLIGVESLASSKPIRTLEDLKGIKIRAPEGLVQNAFSAAGASPVVLPFSEVYTSLEKGVIDAADASIFSAQQALGIHDIASYPLHPGFHSLPVQSITLNKDIWDSLPNDLKSILEVAARKAALEAMYKNELLDAEAVKEAVKNGAEIIDWSAKDRAAFRKIAIKQWEPVAKSSPIAQEFVDTLKAFLESQGATFE